MDGWMDGWMYACTYVRTPCNVCPTCCAIIDQYTSPPMEESAKAAVIERFQQLFDSHMSDLHAHQSGREHNHAQAQTQTQTRAQSQPLAVAARTPQQLKQLRSLHGIGEDRNAKLWYVY